MEVYYLGVHHPHWLADERRRGVPLFVSRRVLYDRKSFPRSVDRWGLDSGSFSDAVWDLTSVDWVREVRLYSSEIGTPDFAAILDWRCVPEVLARTGLTVREHQRRTLDSYLRLRDLAPEIPWIPTLQGFRIWEYVECAEMYERAGVSLASAPVVGVGSIALRQGDVEVRDILRELYGYGFRLHGFGVKSKGLQLAAKYLVSADSMAWSFNARHLPPIEGHAHKNCANCLEGALLWRSRLRF